MSFSSNKINEFAGRPMGETQLDLHDWNQLEQDENWTVEQLIEALGDPNWKVRARAAIMLGKRGTGLAVEPLIEALADQEGWVSIYATESLGQLGPPAVLPLIKALHHPGSEVRKRVVLALGRLGDPRAVGPLLHSLQDEDFNVRSQTVQALGRLGDPRAVGPLIRLLEDNLRMHPRLARALEKRLQPGSGSAPGYQQWGEGLEWAACHQFELNPPAVVDLSAGQQLVDNLLEQEQRGLAEKAAEALGRLGDPRAVEPLWQALLDESPKIRASAAESLGQLKDPLAVQPLLCMLRNRKENKEVTDSVITALGLLGDAAATPFLTGLLRHEEGWRRCLLAQALGNLNDRGAVAALVELLEDADLWVRQAAIEALGKLNDPECLPILTRQLQVETYPANRKATLMALQRLRHGLAAHQPGPNEA